MRRTLRTTALALTTWLVGLAVPGSAAGQDRPDPQPAETPVVLTCFPATGPVTIDGDLREWTLGRAVEIGPAQLVRKSPTYGGATDLSGRILVCRSATTLYVAGEIRDDTVYWNPDVSWRGDGVELFLDLRREAEPRTSDAYDQDTYQILLHPLASEVRWNFASYRGRPGRMDDPIDGIELAGMRFQDELGATVGYRFEVALPLANFAGAPWARGDVFGFDVALSDSDGLPEQRNYATWSGHSDLARYPSRFGRLTVGDDPPPVSAPAAGAGSQSLPIAFLAVVLGLALAVWLARGLDVRESRLAAWLVRVAEVPARRMLIAASTLIVLLVAAGPVTELVADAAAAHDLAEKREIAGLVQAIAAETNTVGLQRPQPPVHPAPLLSLLTGQTVRPPADFDFTVLPPMTVGADGKAVPEPTSRTLSGVPFLRRDIPATAAWSGSFLVQPPVAAQAATLIWSWRPDPAADVPPKPGETVAEVRLMHLDGRVAPPIELVWGRHVDADDDPRAALGGDHGGAPESAVAFVVDQGSPGGPSSGHSHADELRVELGEGDSPVVRVEVEQRTGGGRFTLHGVTLHPRDAADPVPVPLGRSTRSGMPTAASPFPSPDAGILLSRGVPKVDVPCDAPADRLWLVVSLRRGFPDARFGLPVLLVRPEFDDGSVDGPFPLENGLDLDAEAAPARQHGDRFRSELAFEWSLPEQPRRHFDVWSVQLARAGRRLRNVHLEFRGEDEVVRIASVILGSPGRGPSTEGLLHVESGPDGFRVAPPVAERLAGLSFTAFRDGSAYATTFGGAERDRALARTVTTETAAKLVRGQGDLHEVRIFEGRRLHVLAVPLPGARPGTFLEMSWAGDTEDSVASLVLRVRSFLGLLLAPLVVLLVADGIRRLASVHARLVAVSAAVSAIPAVLGFLAVPELVSSRIEEGERENVLEKAAAVKSRLAGFRSEALRRAEAALRDEALREALDRRGNEDFRASVTAALRDLERNLTAETLPGARIALDVMPLSSGAERQVFPPDVQFTVFRDRATQIADALAYRWSRLTARGVAQVFDNEGDWQITLVVDLPIDRAALEAAAAAAGGDVQVQVYTPRGFPLAQTAARSPGEELREETERKVALAQRVLAEQHPVVERRTLGGTQYNVAFDVLRGESGDVSLVATALPRTGADALLSRVGQTALLVFGAGVAAQFLLLGLVAVRTSRPLRRVTERAAGVTGGGPSEDEVETLSAALAELERDRDAYRGEIGRLATAVGDLSRVRDPDGVAAGALDLVRSAVAPWGALLVTTDDAGRAEVLGGFRGEDPVARMPVVVDANSPLVPVLAGRGEAHVAALGAAADAISRDERRLVEGASSLAAYPLAAEGDRGGALVLLDRPGSQRRLHGDFVATLARQIGLALGAARLVRLAVRDPDTGAYVANYFGERLREEVDRAVAAKRPIAVLLVSAATPPRPPADVRAVAQRLGDRLRAESPPRAFLGRVDPLGFAVAVSETDRSAAETLATALRRAAAEPAFAALRLAVGYAACPEDAGSSEFLLAEARRRQAETSGVPAEAPGATGHAGDRLATEARRLGVVVASAESRALLETIHRIAASDVTLLVEGETGAGKEVVADLVHRWSARADHPLVKVNCAALPDALLESELFGYERGAFTGADRSKPGRFELADGGTLFLDEIGEMPLATQAKLLRVLEDRSVEHLGGTRPTPVNVRIVVATNRDLGRSVAEGRFREDLFYRLNAVTISVPPLRARKEDIPPLAESFLRAAAEAHGRRAPVLQPDAMDLLYRHPWPGNVRELRNLMEQIVVLFPSDVVRAADLLPALGRGVRPRPGGEFPRGAPSSSSALRDGPRADPPGASAPDAVSDRQRRLMALLAERTWITTSEYCEIVGISARTGLRDVRELVERGVIVMEGKRRGARYRLP